MKAMTDVPADIDAYIAGYPKPVQVKLRLLQRTIRELVPGAEEKISYCIPTFTRARHRIHFAAFAHHIGIYPGAAAIVAFKDALSGYRTAKGTVQFPLAEPFPIDLIARIVTYCFPVEVPKATRARR